MFQFEPENRKKPDCPQSKIVMQKELFPTLKMVNLFVLLGPSADWVRPGHIREYRLLTQFTD